MAFSWLLDTSLYQETEYVKEVSWCSHRTWPGNNESHWCEQQLPKGILTHHLLLVAWNHWSLAHQKLRKKSPRRTSPDWTPDEKPLPPRNGNLSEWFVVPRGTEMKSQRSPHSMDMVCLDVQAKEKFRLGVELKTCSRNQWKFQFYGRDWPHGQHKGTCHSIWALHDNQGISMEMCVTCNDNTGHPSELLQGP